MSQQPSAEEIARWDRWFAMEMNNRAWTLAETPGLTPAEEEEMLHAAHASVLHWSRVGTESHKARADMLLGQVHALLGDGAPALRYARRSHEYIASHASPDWEIAFSHAVLANAAHAAHEFSLYDREYALAKRLGAEISDAEEKEIFERTFARVPAPQEAGEGFLNRPSPR
jgi:hypothetical protein